MLDHTLALPGLEAFRVQARAALDRGPNSSHLELIRAGAKLRVDARRLADLLGRQVAALDNIGLKNAATQVIDQARERLDVRPEEGIDTARNHNESLAKSVLALADMMASVDVPGSQEAVPCPT